MLRLQAATFLLFCNEQKNKNAGTAYNFHKYFFYYVSLEAHISLRVCGTSNDTFFSVRLF